MDWINYHHLFYFWTVAKEGTVSAAAETLRLTRPTVTAQVRELERTIGQKLFEQKGRYLHLTEFGRSVFTYADDIFSIGRELGEFLRTGRSGSRARFSVGMTDVVPKVVAFDNRRHSPKKLRRRYPLNQSYDPSSKHNKLIKIKGPLDKPK